MYGFLPSCMSVKHVHAWCSGRQDKGVGSLVTGVIDLVIHCVGAGNSTWVLGRTDSAFNH